jgi:hypothetical protein
VDIPAAAYYQELMEAYPDAMVSTHHAHISVSRALRDICAQVVLTKRPSLHWALSALRTICPAAVARGGRFSRHSPFRVPWYVLILRVFLPIAPGTGIAAYQAMMSGILHKLDMADKWGSSDVLVSRGACFHHSIPVLIFYLS